MEPDICVRPPDAVTDVMRLLGAAGHTCYITGGAVRDIVMGRTPSDWDIATSALPEQVKALFPRTIPTGMAHGTVTVVSDGESIEVTTYRSDGPYSDGRRPDYVKFSTDIVEDLSRRDFTMNAMAYDPVHNRLEDPFGGRQDIVNGLIRCVGDAYARFSEDKLRMIRAARFRAVLEFDVDEGIIDACDALAPEITQVSVERVTQELTRMMSAPSPSKGLELMDRTGLLGTIIPELVERTDAAYRAGLYSKCDVLPPSPWERMAMLLWPLGPDRAQEVLTRMRTSRRQARTAASIISGAQAIEAAFSEVGEADDWSLRGIARSVGAEGLLGSVRVYCAFHPEAQESAWGGDSLQLRAAGVLAANPPLKVSDLAIDGKDVMQVTGLKRGPSVREVLEALLDDVIRDPSANTREHLLELAVSVCGGRT